MRPEPARPYWLPHVGHVWHWEPLRPWASEEVTVTAVKWDGDEWMVESESPRGRHWNDLGRWVEAAVFVRSGPQA